MKKLPRRDFLKATASMAAACGMAKLTGCGSSGSPAVPDTAETPEPQPQPQPEPEPSPQPTAMPTRPFGQTGFDVGLFSLGGQAALERSGQESVSEKILDRALELGVNYIDTSAYYGGGLSEQNIGRAIASRRSDVFLATKSLERSYDGAMRDLERSLVNLRTDHVDLWQVHNLTTRSDWSAVLAPGGALDAFQQAKREGTARFIGVSGHYDPEVLTDAVQSGAFDAVLMALNAADVHHRSFAEDTLLEASDRGMGIVAMKVPARGQIFRAGGLTTMEQALCYTLTYPVSTAIIGCSTVAEVEENAALARNFEPLSSDEMRRLEGLTESYYREATWFKA